MSRYGNTMHILSKPMFSSLSLTPRRHLDFDSDFEDADLIMTPKVKKDLTSLFLDDDSGLGLDGDQEQITPAKPNGLSPLSFSGRLNCEDVSVEKVTKPQESLRVRGNRRSLFSGKRKRQESDLGKPRKLARNTTSGLKRAYSFDEHRHSTHDEEVALDDVKDAVNRLVEDEDLVADGTGNFCLPTVRGKHQDLKSITPQTMADVLNGKYDDVIGSCRVIDCRYPYEYNGGHIKGAKNLYTRESVLELLRHHKPTNQNGKRDILVFHCEFSSERGPKMSRFLRAEDRDMNKHRYPALTYPEVYLLHGGYKAFFKTDDNKTLCQPMHYTPMAHKEHTEDLRHFRSRSKSWTAGEKRKNALRLRF